MKKNFLGLILSSIVCIINPAFSMMQDDSILQEKPQNKIVLHIPEEFPGHNAKLIQGTVKISNYFDPAEYQQEKLRGEGACKFNSMLAGIMHTPYGRAKVQAIIESQDDIYINIRFYFPSTDFLRKYDNTYQTTLKDCNNELVSLQQILETLQDEERKKEYQEDINEVKIDLEKASLLWNKVLNFPQTTVRVPKQFISREDKGSFPHNNPGWLNLIQQAYMKTTKNQYVNFYSHGRYSPEEEISENDCFSGVPFFELYQGSYMNTPSGLTNLIPNQALMFFPLIDIPMKSVVLMINKDGLDLPAIRDFKAERQLNETIIYAPMIYKSVVDFAHTHGLSKGLLMASNVLQFDSASHAVALFFSEGKVYYYDNVHFPEQVKVYGTKGPVYEEAIHFKGQDVNTMSEQEFFTRLFQEITQRLKQVTDVRGQESVFHTKISFFERPLVNQ